MTCSLPAPAFGRKLKGEAYGFMDPQGGEGTAGLRRAVGPHALGSRLSTLVLCISGGRVWAQDLHHCRQAVGGTEALGRGGRPIIFLFLIFIGV